MTARTYLRLPINADDGFPQAFRLNFAGRAYRVTLYANVPEDDGSGAIDPVYDLPVPGAFMVMRVARDDAATPDVIFQRKLVLNLEYEAAELAFVFRQIRVARANLNNVGTFGSVVLGGVAQRWAS